MKEDADKEPHEDGGRDGREGATSPRTPGAPKLEKAGTPNVEGSGLNPVPRGTGCTCLPRFLHLYVA